jgi:proteasome lid subunit RPN8/RPN11
VSNAPLKVTSDVLSAVVKDCVAARPTEACGFILADKGSPVGFDIRPMTNVAPNPVQHYAMDDEEVLAAYAGFDQVGLDPVAVYHSHVASPPLMSERDLEQAHDTSVTYLIVSLEGDRPRARAYRVRRPFIGQVEYDEVNIVVADRDLAVVTPEGPWALTAGNEVAITYSRPRVTATTVINARVIACGAGGVGLEPVAPGQRNVPPSLPLDRIKQVEVIKESPAAVELRRALRTHARHVVAALGDGDVSVLPPLTHALAEAFPTTVRVVVREIEENPS